MAWFEMTGIVCIATSAWNSKNCPTDAVYFVVVEVAVVVVVVVVVVIVVFIGAQQSNPSGNSAPQLSKLSWQKRPALQWESLSQSPSPSKHGHSSLQHAKSLRAPPQSDGQPK